MNKAQKKTNISSKKQGLSVRVKKGKNVKKKKNSIPKQTRKKEQKKPRKVAPKKRASAKIFPPTSISPEPIPGRIVSMEVEKEKRLIMIFGVIFFMILIGSVWLYNIKKVIQSSSVGKNNEQAGSISWQEMTDEITNKIDELKTGLEDIKEFSGESSTAVANTENQERNIFSLPDSATSSKTISTSSRESLDKLKEKLKELNNN